MAAQPSLKIRWPALAAALVIAAAATCRVAFLRADGQADNDTARRRFPTPPTSEPIQISADLIQQWQEADHSVAILRRRCAITQGALSLRSDEAVLWVYAPLSNQSETRLVVYLEGNVTTDSPAGTRNDPSLAVQLKTTEPLRIHSQSSVRRVGRGAAVFARALRATDALPLPSPRQEGPRRPVPLPNGDPSDAPVVQQALFQLPTVEPAQPAQPKVRRFRIFQRSRNRFNVEGWTRPGTPPEQVVVVTGGVNIIIEGVGELGTVDIETDNMVLWTRSLQPPNMAGETVQAGATPLELYLEGNVVIRQGPPGNERTMKAPQIYYDVDDHRAEVIDGELKFFDPRLQGPLRMRAERFMQLNENQYQAIEAWITSSKMGSPGWRIQSQDLTLNEQRELVTDPQTGLPEIDPSSGEPRTRAQRSVTAVNNFFFMDGVPLLYWPYISTRLDDADVALERIRLRQDRIFGTQVLTDWDLFELLGITNPPADTRWGLSLDYLSDRGPAIGTDADYRGTQLFGIEGAYHGRLDGYLIEDHGLDNLGSDRRALEPEADPRGRLLWLHRHELPYDLVLLAEVGLVSDRNFLEQYYEDEFDQGKDQETLAYLKQQRGQWAWSALVQGRVNDFDTSTVWLPRLDHYWLGQSLLGDRLTWYTHSFAGYGVLWPASFPNDPADRAKFVRRPWEVYTAALQGATRHEVDLPFQLGPVRLVPYGMGEVAGWSEDLTGQSLGRLFGVVGVRGSVPFWRVYPWVDSQLWNLHGLAHKIVLEWDYSLAGATEDFTRLPLFNPLDDDPQEKFRRRFTVNTFGGAIPPMFDERFFAIRSGVQNYVASPYTELATDQQALRAGIRQRLQTKRGPEENRRIIDWMTLDLEGTWFPADNRDNFGEPLGLLQYDYTWHVGDRTSLLSSGQLDTFEDGGKLWSIGAYLTRPPRGSFYLGYDILGGPINSQFLTFSYNYVMSPKWVSSFVNQVDLGQGRNVGQSLVITRVGADFLFSFGFNVDANKNNVGVSVAVQPRIAPEIRLGSVRGARVPPGAVAPFE